MTLRLVPPLEPLGMLVGASNQPMLGFVEAIVEDSGGISDHNGYLLAIAVIAGWIVSVCLHEFGHAIVAYWGGDTTVKDKGYLTLNPLKYTDIGYSLALPVVFLILGGIALPGAAVYINTKLLRSRGWKSAVSAAGPVMTGIVAIALALPFRLGWATEEGWIWSALALLASYQVAGLCFNLFPIPSFDGFGIVEPWLPQALQQSVRRWGRYGYLVLFAVLWTVPAANQGFWGLVHGLSTVLGIPLDRVSLGYQAFAQPSKVIFIGLLLAALFFRKVMGGTFNQPTETEHLTMNLAAYDRLIQAGQATPDIWQHRGDVLQALEQYEGAISSYNKALQGQSASSDLWHNHAICLHNLQHYDQALKSYDQALKLQPENGDIWANKARALRILKRYKAAVAAYDQSLKYRPSELKNWQARGQLLFDLQDYAAALSNFARVLKYQPNNPMLWITHARALDRLGQSEQAGKSYQQALRYGNAFEKGTVYFDRKEYEKAITAFDQCLQYKINNASAHYNKACCYALLGKPDLALQSLTELYHCGARSLLREASTDADLQSLHHLEMFQQLIRTANAS